MPDGNNSGIFSGRPAFSLDGRDNAELGAGLLALSIAESISGLYRCEALFGNWGAQGFRYFDRRVIDFGKTMNVKFGDDLLFDGHITAIEGRFPEGAPPQINVLAEDRLQDLRMTRRTRTFENLRDSDVFSRIASEHGLQASADLQGPQHKVLAQVNQSDLAFLRDRARALGAEVWIEGTTVHADQRTSRAARSSIELALNARLREFSVIADLSQQCTSLTIGGWNVSDKSAQTHEAAQAAIQSELEGGDSGVSILQSSLGTRKQALVHGVPLSSDDAKAQAEGAFRAIARRFVVGRGRATPDGKLRVGSSVQLKGLGSLFDGKYYLSEVCHLFDGAKGLRTEFTAERPFIGKP